MTIDNGTTVKTMKFYYDVEGRPMCLDYNGTIYFYITNLQGDVVQIVSANQNYTGWYRYDAWGKIFEENGNHSGIAEALSLNPLRYRGYIYDAETGFYYLQSRYYDPTIGRFINSDGQLNGGFLGNNMFAYCGNNPVFFVDITGQNREPVLSLLGYWIVHKMVQYDCVSKNADLYTEVYVLSNEGKRGYLDLYDLKTNTFYEVKHYTVSQSSIDRQMNRYKNSLVQETEKIPNPPTTSPTMGTMTLSGEFNYGLYKVNYYGSAETQGLILYRISWNDSMENVFDTVESYAGAFAKSTADCAEQMAPIICTLLIVIACAGGAVLAFA